MIRVAVAEDNLLVREGIVQVLNAAPDVEVVAAARAPRHCWRRSPTGKPTSS